MEVLSPRLDRLQPRRRRYERRGRCLRPRCRLERDDRVSLSTAGRQGNRGSYAPAISPDGRYVAFVSEASTWSRATRTTWPMCSCRHADRDDRAGQRRQRRRSGKRREWVGQHVASAPTAVSLLQLERSNLVAGDTNDVIDAFVHDRRLARPNASASRPAAMRRMPSASERSRSAATGGSSRSAPWRRTSRPGIPTTSSTSLSTTARPW